MRALVVHTYIHTLHYITLHCIALHCITLHYITLHYIHTCTHIHTHRVENPIIIVIITMTLTIPITVLLIILWLANNCNMSAELSGSVPLFEQQRVTCLTYCGWKKILHHFVQYYIIMCIPVGDFSQFQEYHSIDWDWLWQKYSSIDWIGAGNNYIKLERSTVFHCHPTNNDELSNSF